MVAINLKYTEEELTQKGGNFFCGSGYVKCLIVSNEIADSRYSTAAKPKPKVLKVYYHVAAGEYQGAESDIEFELWNDEVINFANGGSAPASQLAGQNFRALSLACGFDKTVADSDQLNQKFVMIKHDVQKGQPIEEENEYGQKTPKLDENGKQQHYPDRSILAKGRDKFKAVPAVATPHAPVTPTTPAAPHQPAPLPPVSGQPPVVPQAPQLDDNIPF